MDRPVCTHFVRGACAFGPRCSKSHEIVTIDYQSRPACEHHKRGTCSYGSSCKKDHGSGLKGVTNTSTATPTKVICPHFLKGRCRFGSRCTKLHPGDEGSKSEDDLCTFFDPFRGNGCDKGIQCFFKHIRAGKPLPTVIATVGPIEMISSYSVTRDNRVEYSDRACRQFRAMPVKGARLDQGKDLFIKNECSTATKPQNLDSLLRALTMAPRGIDILARSNVVTRRGILTRLMMRLKIRLNISFIDGIMFIEESTTPVDEYNPNSTPNSSPEVSEAHLYLHPRDYAGRVFEQLCVENAANTQSETEVVPAEERWIAIGHREIGEFKCIIAGEVDCTDENGELLELKARSIHGLNDDRFWRKTYIQSFLLDVSKVVVGFHEAGALEQVDSYKLEALHEKFQPWDPNEAISLVHHILKNMRQCCLRALGQNWRTRAATESNSIWDVVFGNDPHGEPFSVRRLSVEEVKSLQSTRHSAEGAMMGIVPMSIVDAIREAKSNKYQAVKAVVNETRK